MGLLYTVSKTQNEDKRPLPGAEKRNLLRAALYCFASYGFAQASLKKIADEAEMTAAMVNYYFGSKQQLYTETLKMCYEQFLELATERTKLATTLEDFLSRMLYVHMEYAHSYPDAAKLIVKTSFCFTDVQQQDELHCFESFRSLVLKKLMESANKGAFASDNSMSIEEIAEYFLGQGEFILIRHVQAQNIQDPARHPIPKIDDILKAFLLGIGLKSDK